MKRVMISGATGMVGLALIDECLRNNVEVYALVRADSRRINKIPLSDRVHIIRAGLEDLDNVDFPEDSIDVFYHLGWAGTGSTERNDYYLQEKNIGYALTAVRLAKKCGCSKFIGAGSQAEYGPVTGRIDDSTPLKANTAYGLAKTSACRMSAGLCEQLGLIHIWGRIFSVYGINDKPGTMIDYAMRSFTDGKEAHFSSGGQTWNYLYEEDAGRVFYLMGQKCDNSREYRIAGNEQKKLRKFIDEAATIMNANELCVFDKPGSVYSIETDITILERELGFVPRVTFADGIRRIRDHYEMAK